MFMLVQIVAYSTVYKLVSIRVLYTAKMYSTMQCSVHCKLAREASNPQRTHQPIQLLESLSTIFCTVVAIMKSEIAIMKIIVKVKAILIMIV